MYTNSRTRFLLIERFKSYIVDLKIDLKTSQLCSVCSALATDTIQQGCNPMILSRFVSGMLQVEGPHI